MARRLRFSVFLAHPVGSIPQRFRAGTAATDLPDGVAERIVNPAAWVDVDDVPAPAVVDPQPVPLALDDDDDEVAPIAPVTEQGSSEPLPTLPARTGPGSSRAAWASFAEAMGQPVDAADGRDDIIDALESAGLLAAER